MVTINGLKVEFPKKSRRKRERLFKVRARANVRALAIAFYKSNDISIDPPTLNAVVESIVGELSDLGKEREFRTKVLHPDVKDGADLVEKLYLEVAKVANNKEPFAFLDKSKRSA